MVLPYNEQRAMRRQIAELRSDLHLCVIDDDLPRLHDLLQNASPNEVNNQHKCRIGAPLHVAVHCGSLLAVKALLRAGALPLLQAMRSDEWETKWSPLSIAARHGYDEILQLLCSRVPIDKVVDESLAGDSALGQAARYGQHRAINYLLDWTRWPQTLKDIALYNAASRWDADTVRLLLARVKFEKQALNTALQSVCSFMMDNGELDERESYPHGAHFVDQRDTIIQLIQQGADPDAENSVHSMFGANRQIRLVPETARFVALGIALEALLNQGADPNGPDRRGNTALHYLGSPVRIDSHNGRHELHHTGLRLLLKSGASVVAKNHEGTTPLHIAAFGAGLETFQKYLAAHENGENILGLSQITNNQNENLLHFAALGGKLDTMQFLLSNSFDVNAKADDGWTPLHCALIRSAVLSPGLSHSPKSLSTATKAAQLLLSQGADPLVATSEGWTPLHLLAYWRDDNKTDDARILADQLISAGAEIYRRAPFLFHYYPMPFTGKRKHGEVKVKSRWGYSVHPDFDAEDFGPQAALQWAAKHKAMGVVKALLANGAVVTPTDSSEVSPVKLAVEPKWTQGDTDKLRDEIVDLLTSCGGGL